MNRNDEQNYQETINCEEKHLGGGELVGNFEEEKLVKNLLNLNSLMT